MVQLRPRGEIEKGGPVLTLSPTGSFGGRMASMIRDPKLRLPKIKQSITLKAEFTSTIRAEGDADAKEFMAQLRALIAKFKPKSTFKYTGTEQR